MPRDAREVRLRHDLFRDGGTRIRVKVCCIASVDEAAMALDAGADALGLVSAMPSGPGPIEESEIAGVVEWVGDRADTVLLTSLQTAREIAGQDARLRPSVLQLVDSLTSEALRELRTLAPSSAIMPVLHVPAGNALEEALRVAPDCDAVLLDSGNPTAAVKELGGTGRIHDWNVSRTIVERAGRPVFLAGGLSAANVASAINAVRPFGVDVCSGVRTNGMLDGAKVRAFVDAARNA